MKTIKLFFSTLLVVIISAIGMASCIDDDELKDKVVVITMSVSENTDIMYSLFDDHKENPIECMLFMEDGVDQTWRKMGFSSIEGFTYEKGHRYKLRAKKTILANPPADASAWIYELVEVLEDKEIIGPELPVEDAIKSETDIVYEEQCPIEKYSVSSPIFVDGNGKIYSSEGNERPSYKNCRIYLNNTLDPTDTDWVRFNSTTYMARYAYVISPLSDKIRLVVASGGGPMLKYIVTEDDFRYVTTTMNKGEQLTYVLILANANKRGIQKLELAFERK